MGSEGTILDVVEGLDNLKLQVEIEVQGPEGPDDEWLLHARVSRRCPWIAVSWVPGQGFTVAVESAKGYGLPDPTYNDAPTTVAAVRKLLHEMTWARGKAANPD